MSSQRTHYVTTADGVAIGGTVHGEGPPVVFLHGAIGDGDIDWARMLGYLTEAFTCYLPSMRGRGLSGDHPDLGLGRVIDDYVAYVDSIGEPTGLVGWSGGANHALAVAAQSDAVNAVAPYEPVANSQMDEQERATLGAALASMRALAGEGASTAAVRAFLGYALNDEDMVIAQDAGYFEATERYVGHTLEFFRQFAEHDGPLPDDPAVLGAVSAPVLVLLGSDTKPFLTASAQHVADHVPNARILEIPGAGHAAPLTHPEAFAEALTEFFEGARGPA